MAQALKIPQSSEGWRLLAQKMANRSEIQDGDRAGMKLAIGYSRRSLYCWHKAVALERLPEKFIVFPAEMRP